MIKAKRVFSTSSVDVEPPEKPYQVSDRGEAMQGLEHSLLGNSRLDKTEKEPG
jgi:hypothetical protein